MKPTMPAFQDARLLVVGDVMLDRYWHGKASRISPEAPVPVVRVGKRERKRALSRRALEALDRWSGAPDQGRPTNQCATARH